MFREWENEKREQKKAQNKTKQTHSFSIYFIYVISLSQLKAFTRQIQHLHQITIVDEIERGSFIAVIFPLLFDLNRSILISYCLLFVVTFMCVCAFFSLIHSDPNRRKNTIAEQSSEWTKDKKKKNHSSDRKIA